MMDNNFSGVVDSLLKGMDSVLSTKTVVGEATKIGDTIILPLVDVTFGVGAGASKGDKKNGGMGGYGNKDPGYDTGSRGAFYHEKRRYACGRGSGGDRLSGGKRVTISPGTS